MLHVFDDRAGYDELVQVRHLVGGRIRDLFFLQLTRTASCIFAEAGNGGSGPLKQWLTILYNHFQNQSISFRASKVRKLSNIFQGDHYERSIVFARRRSAFFRGSVSPARRRFFGHMDARRQQVEIGERARIESMTMTVTQTAKDIKVDSKTRSNTPARPRAPAGTGGGGGMGRGGGFGGGDMSTHLYARRKGNHG